MSADRCCLSYPLPSPAPSSDHPFKEPYEDVIALLRKDPPPARLDLTRIMRAVAAWERELAFWRSDAIDFERRVSLIPRCHVLEARIAHARALIDSSRCLTTTLQGVAAIARRQSR